MFDRNATKFRGQLLIAIAIVLLASMSSVAADIQDYANRVRTAASLVNSLAGDGSTNGAVTDRTRSIVARIRELVPVTESITWSGGVSETSNAWLHDGLGILLAGSDDDTRRQIIDSLSERLISIQYELDKQSTATAVSPTRDEDKRKLAEILNREEFAKPAEQEESLALRLWRRFVEWFSSNFPRAGITPSSAGGLGDLSALLQILIYGLLAAAIGFLLYRLALRVPAIRTRRRSRNSGDRVILGEKIESDVTPADLFDEAETLAGRGELRHAIRKGYIALLCELADRRVIGLAHNKTNRDYLRDVRSRRSLFDDLRRLTHSFEAHWYGPRASDQAAWETFRDNCRGALKRDSE